MAVGWCSTTALAPQIPTTGIRTRRNHASSKQPHFSSSPTHLSLSSNHPLTIPNTKAHRLWRGRHPNPIPTLNCTTSGTDTDIKEKEDTQSQSLDCVGTGLDVECLVSSSDQNQNENQNETQNQSALQQAWELAVLISPFFFWGTSMVAMKEVLPKAGPFFVSSFRLIPAGFLVVAFAAFRGRPFPSGLSAWLSIALFGLVDASCFQGFLGQGLERTSAGLGSVSFAKFPFSSVKLN